MRIAIDARELAGRPTGVGRFLGEVLQAWTRSPLAREHEYVLCAPGEINLEPFAGLQMSSRVRGGGSGTAWEQLVLPGLVREAHADILLAPAYTAPLRSPVPVVLVIHDVSFAAHPEWFSWGEGARRRTITRLAAQRAARVVTVSEFSKREIVAHLGIEPQRITVIHHGLTDVARAFTAREANHEGSPHGNRVLYVGSIFNRRHIPELIAAFASVAAVRPDLHLDVVGDNRTSPPVDLDALAAVSGVGHRIHLRAYVGDDALHRLYRSAAAFAFLSDYEGFGLTPLEALGAGVPIVVLDTAVAREVYGDAAIYVNRPEPGLIAHALASALFDAGERDRVLAAAQQLLPRYSWDRAAAQLLETITRALP